MAAEVWQFVVVLSVFAVAAVLWLCIIYLPARTLEHWKGQRPGGDKGGFSGKSG